MGKPAAVGKQMAEAEAEEGGQEVAMALDSGGPGLEALFCCFLAVVSLGNYSPPQVCFTSHHFCEN